jgi:hypothetical protein
MLLTKMRSLNMIKKATLVVAFLFTFSIFLGASWAATDQLKVADAQTIVKKQH